MFEVDHYVALMVVTVPIGLIFMGGVYIYVEDINNRMDGIDFKLDRIQRMEMYDKTPDTVYENESVILNGLYHPSQGFYCVWVENRTYEQINNTVNHELLHAMIHKKPEHFCGGE